MAGIVMVAVVTKMVIAAAALGLDMMTLMLAMKAPYDHQMVLHFFFRC